MISQKLTTFLSKIKEEDQQGSKTKPHLRRTAKEFLNTREYEEYETFIFPWGEIDVHLVLCALIYDQI